MPQIHVASSPVEVAARVATTIEGIAGAAIRDRGRASLALPGGSVADTCLPRLTSVRLEWRRVHVAFGDDRAVPPDDADSNYGRASRLLLSRVPVPSAHVYRIPGESPDLDVAAADYERTLVGALGTPPVIDVVLLGVGEDGHVCSLFPGHDVAPAPAGWVAAVRDAPKPPPRRLTLTMPTLLAARHVLVVAMGAAKAPAIREALADQASLLPVARVLHAGQQVELVLDTAAAAP